MNTPISFKLAKLLQKKGFNEQTLSIYQDGEILWLVSTISNSQFLTSRNYSAPTITQVVMWLYEKHGIWIWVRKSNNSEKFFWRLCGEKEPWRTPSNGRYNSPTEAYEAAIEYTLKNLI